MRDRHIVFFSDRYGLPGLHVTLASALAHQNEEESSRIEAHVFCDKLSTRHVREVESTARLSGKPVDLKFHDYKPRDLPGAGSIRGNLTTLGRLFLADLLPLHKQVLYLDIDLLVCTSLSPLFERFDRSVPLFAAGLTERASFADSDLFRQAGLDMGGMAFNAGVLGVNLEVWREIDAQESFFEVARRYSGAITTADQAILNIVFADQVLDFGAKYNIYAHRTMHLGVGEVDGIYHFFGSPKPWDFLGSRVHAGYGLWAHYFQRTAIANRSLWLYRSPLKIVRGFPTTLKKIRR